MTSLAELLSTLFPSKPMYTFVDASNKPEELTECSISFKISSPYPHVPFPRRLLKTPTAACKKTETCGEVSLPKELGAMGSKIGLKEMSEKVGSWCLLFTRGFGLGLQSAGNISSNESNKSQNWR